MRKMPVPIPSLEQEIGVLKVPFYLSFSSDNQAKAQQKFGTTHQKQPLGGNKLLASIGPLP